MEDGTGDALPEEATEVLYINNLNERIKLEGEPAAARFQALAERALTLLLSCSHEAVIDDAIQGVRQGAGRHGSPQHQDEGASIRDARLEGRSSEGGQGSEGIPTIRQTNGAHFATSLQRLSPVRTAELMFVLPSLQQLTFARTRSDALVKKVTPEEMDQHKEERLKRKSKHPLRRASKLNRAVLTLLPRFRQRSRDETTLSVASTSHKRKRPRRVSCTCSSRP